MNPPSPTVQDLHVLLTGDLILDEPGPDAYFDPARAVLQAADVVVGHVEVPHTNRGLESSTDVPAPPANPDHLAALPRAHVHIATLAGNHMHDSGPQGIADTVATLQGLGLATTGAGMGLAQARTPAVVERQGRRVGVLSYNCVGPREGWATSRKPGCAYVKVLTHYELDHASPGGPPTIYTFAAPDSLDAMAADIAALRPQVDLLLVALHKGVGHVPARIEHYEFAVGRAAIDAGADAVVGHHAHIGRGVELHHGRPIYHGLGNFVTVTHALTVEGNASPERLAWARKRQQLFGFAPDPRMPAYPFHPDSRHTWLASLKLRADGTLQPGLLPCWIDDDARPVPLAPDDARTPATVAYLRQITATAGLKTRYDWQDGHLAVLPA